MTDRLFGRAPAVELVRALMQRSANPASVGERLPVLVFEGMRGSGKTVLLKALAGLLDQRVPYAHLDFEAGGQVRTEVRRVLATVAVDLSRRCPLYGRLRFPRLAIGQQVADAPVDRNDPRAAVINILRTQRRIDTVVAMLKDTAGQAGAAMSLAPQVPVGLAGTALDLLVAGLTARGPGRRLVLGKHQHWYGHRDSDDTTDSVDALVQLNRWAHSARSDDARHQAQQLLWAAFFADLRANFARLALRGMPLGCVVLLDNVDTPLGRTFLAQLVAARRVVTAEGGSVPLTVVATSRGGLLGDRPATEWKVFPDQPDEAVAAFVSRVAGGQRPTWLRYRLSDLTEAEEFAELAAVLLRGGGPPDADRLTYEFTGGHPLSASVVLAAFAEHGADGVGLDALLDRPVSVDDATASRWSVQERLCRGLLGVGAKAGFPDPTVEHLTTCAAGCDADEAAELFPDGIPVAADVRIKGADLWADRSGARLLRLLLLRRLAGRSGEAVDDWTRVHHRLRERCVRGLDGGDAVGEMYHRLAAGDLAAVARWLAARLTGPGPWLPLLRAVAAAPSPGPRDRAPLDVVGDLTDAVRAAAAELPPDDPVDRHFWSVLRVLAGVWVAADPLRGNDRAELHAELATWCRSLATDCPNRRNELRELAREHERLANQWTERSGA